MKSLREQIFGSGIFHSIDLHFADFILEQNRRSVGNSGRELYLAALFTSYCTNRQHSAFKLASAAGRKLSEFVEVDWPPYAIDMTLPPFDYWIKTLRNADHVVGGAGSLKPLVLSEDGLLYLHRFWRFEQEVMASIRKRYETCEVSEGTSRGLRDLFANDNQAQTDWQQVAAFAALRNRFCVISGGPGTGKTTTVGKVLALSLQEEPKLEIALVAPTGKAADRLVESIRTFKSLANTSGPQGYRFDQESIDRIPEEASTIHRYLGYSPGRGGYLYNRDNMRTTDVMLVDEASMVSLPLFARLFDAIQDDCRVILLGDKDQLAAVENGNVLGDITRTDRIDRFSVDFCAAYSRASGNIFNNFAEGLNPIDDCIVRLERSFRFDEKSGIGQLARAVNRIIDPSGADSVFALFEQFDNINLTDVPEEQEIVSALRQVVSSKLHDFKEIVQDGTPAQILSALGGFRVLCAVHDGPYGVTNLNDCLRGILFPKTRDDELHYHGRPVMVTVNDYNLSLFNGDVGIILRQGDLLTAYFPGVPGETPRKFPVSTLPEHVTAFAMTIHKSQGSEFDDVLMVLPDHDSRVLAKEIIYTSITRAKKTVTIWAGRDIFIKAITRKTERFSGLRM